MVERVVVRPTESAPLPWRSSLFLLIPVTMGIVMVAVAVVMWQQERAYATEGSTATGQVTRRWVVAGSESDEYHLAYQFRTAAGARYSGSGTVSFDRYRQTDVGDAIDVTYLDSTPAANRLSGAFPWFLPFLIGIVGGLVALIGGWVLVGNTRRLARPAMQGPGALGPAISTGATYVFTRPLVRVVVDLLGAPVGAILFLGFAWFIGIANIAGADWATRGVFVIGFGFFGLLLVSGVPSSIRRGLRPAVLEVGPDGLWTPEMGRLAWFEVAEVRLESVRAFSGQHEDGAMTTYGRLGIVPVDPERAAAERLRPAWTLTQGFFNVVRRLRPGAGVPDLDRIAPFGVYDYDLGGSLDTAAAAVRLYREIS